MASWTLLGHLKEFGWLVLKRSTCLGLALKWILTYFDPKSYDTLEDQCQASARFHKPRRWACGASLPSKELLASAKRGVWNLPTAQSIWRSETIPSAAPPEGHKKVLVIFPAPRTRKTGCGPMAIHGYSVCVCDIKHWSLLSCMGSSYMEPTCLCSCADGVAGTTWAPAGWQLANFNFPKILWTDRFPLKKPTLRPTSIYAPVVSACPRSLEDPQSHPEGAALSEVLHLFMSLR